MEYTYTGSARWQQLAPKPNKYGITNIVVTGNKIFVIGYTLLYFMDRTGGVGGTTLSSPWNLVANPSSVAGKKVLCMHLY